MKIFNKRNDCYTNVCNKIKQCWSNINYVYKVYNWFDYMFENPFNIWYNKSIFGLYTVALSWKSKYGESRYEDDPFIQVNLFGICFKLQFVCPFDNIATIESYWESILEYYGKLYEHKIPNLYKIIQKNTWINVNGDKFDTTVILTNRGYLKYLNDMHHTHEEQNKI